MIDMRPRTPAEHRVAEDVAWLARNPVALIALTMAWQEVQARRRRSRVRRCAVAAAAALILVAGCVASWSPRGTDGPEGGAPSIAELEVAFRSRDRERVAEVALRVLATVDPRMMSSPGGWAEDHYLDRCDWVVGAAAMAGTVDREVATEFLREAMGVAQPSTSRTAAIIWQRIDVEWWANEADRMLILRAIEGEG